MSWQNFEKQVSDLFQLLGYEVTADISVQSGQTDALALSPKRTKPNLLIECKFHDQDSRKVSVDEVENFAARVLRMRMEGIIDHGYLVTNTGFTAPAKGSVFESSSRHFVFLVTYDELTHRLIDTQFYLTDYVKRFEASGAEQRFVDLAVQDRRTALRSLVSGESIADELWDRELGASTRAGGHVRPSRRRHMETYGCSSYIDSFLESHKGRFLLLLGDFGCGKTTTLRHTMYRMAKKKLENPVDVTTPTPLLISLRNYNKVVDFDSLILTFLSQEVGTDNVSLPIFKRLNELGHFVLLLDGFDEMARLVTETERRLTFRGICEEVTARNRVIVSGRPGYFPNERQMVESLYPLRKQTDAAFQNPQLSDVIDHVWMGYMQLMTSTQLRDYLKKHCSKAEEKAVNGLIRLQSLLDLARRPVLTNMVIETASDLAKTASRSVTVQQLYKIYTDKWIRREEDKGFFRLLVNPRKKASFLGLVALNMHNEGSLKVHYTELNARIGAFFGLEKSDDVDHFSHDIRTCSFLSRDDDGYYQFIHKSFMEYFVANEWLEFGDSVFSVRITKPFNRDIVRFIESDTDLPLFARAALILKECFDRAKEESVANQDFSHAAYLRDAAEMMFDLLTRDWPRYVNLGESEVFSQLLTPVVRDIKRAEEDDTAATHLKLVMTDEELRAKLGDICISTLRELLNTTTDRDAD